MMEKLEVNNVRVVSPANDFTISIDFRCDFINFNFGNETVKCGENYQLNSLVAP